MIFWEVYLLFLDVKGGGKDTTNNVRDKRTNFYLRYKVGEKCLWRPGGGDESCGVEDSTNDATKYATIKLL